jgi:hypothetical protein
MCVSDNVCKPREGNVCTAQLPRWLGSMFDRRDDDVFSESFRTWTDGREWGNNGFPLLVHPRPYFRIRVKHLLRSLFV